MLYNMIALTIINVPHESAALTNSTLQ